VVMMTNKQLVSVLIVNYNGRKHLKGCLSSLRGQAYNNYEAILVDTGSTDGSAHFVAEHFPWVKVIKLPKNMGFAGGNNVGFTQAKGDYIALLNNDTEVEKGWLSSLVGVANSNETIGAVGSKILFFKKFLPVMFTTETFIPWNRDASKDARLLGFKLQDNICFEGVDYKKNLYESGFYDEEWDTINHCNFRWTSGVARVFIPYDESLKSHTLTFYAASNDNNSYNKTVNVFIGNTLFDTIVINKRYIKYEIKFNSDVGQKHGVRIIQNAGSYRRHAGIAGDIGFGEVDQGQFDRERELNNLCGCSVLLKRKMLNEIGFFDDRLFMYFEDTDLFWRAQKRGWKLMYCPRSVVRHLHASSSQEWSSFFKFHVFSNRFLIVLKNGNYSEIIHAFYALIKPFGRSIVDIIQSVLKRSFNKSALANIHEQSTILFRAFRNTIPFIYTRFKAGS